MRNRIRVTIMYFAIESNARQLFWWPFNDLLRRQRIGEALLQPFAIFANILRQPGGQRVARFEQPVASPIAQVPTGMRFAREDGLLTLGRHHLLVTTPI